MKRELYDVLAEIPGTVAKPRAKRKREDGRQQANSILSSYTTLQTRSPLKARGVNEARREDVDGEQSEACRMLPCVICGAPPPSEPHHDPKRSQGGLDADTGPICAAHHAESETMPLSRFRRKYGLNWSDVTDAVQSWMAAGYPQGQKPWGRG